MNRTTVRSLLLAGLGLFATSRLQAADLFQIDAVTFTTTYSASDKSVVDLVQNLITGTGHFAPLANTTFVANLNYAGVANAIRFNVTGGPGAWQARLTSPYTGLNQVFNGATRDQLNSRIQDFIKKDGSNEWNKFLRAMAERSTVSSTDGNPGSATALIADQAFDQFASPMAETREEKESDQDSSGRFGFGITADAGMIRSGNFKGTSLSLPLYLPVKLTDRVGMVINLPINYTEIEGSQIYNVGFGLALPIKVIKATKENPWAWQLTPSGGGVGSASIDMASGGILAQGTLSSALSHDFGSFTLSMGNQFTMVEGVPVTISGYKFDPQVSQQIVKNGLKLAVPFGRRWVGSLYAVRTDFLARAAIGDYYTIGGEIGYRFLGKPGGKKKRGYVKLGLYSDIAENYTSPHIQFGSGWKF